MEARYEERRRTFKAGVDAARQRREDALLEQTQNRDDLVSQMRKMAFAECNIQEDDVVDVEMTSKKTRRKRTTVTRWQYFARQFMIADWFIDVPDNLETEWRVYVRPEGDRCMLFSDSGRITIRRKTGRIVRKFFDARFPKGETIIDGVNIKSEFVCLDLLMWAGVELMNAEFQCRHVFLHSRLDEMQPWDAADLTLTHVDAEMATCSNIEQLYLRAIEQKDGFVPDGFYFIHQESTYIGGLSPLALVWRDHSISRFAVDNMVGNTLPQDEVCVLSLRKGNRLRTEDRQIVASLQPEDLHGIPVKSLVKCRIVNWPEEDKITVEVIGKSRPPRILADSWSRIQAQHSLRLNHSSIQNDANAPSRRLLDRLLSLVRNNTPDSAERELKYCRRET